MEAAVVVYGSEVFRCCHCQTVVSWVLAAFDFLGQNRCQVKEEEDAVRAEVLGNLAAASLVEAVVSLEEESEMNALLLRNSKCGLHWSGNLALV